MRYLFSMLQKAMELFGSIGGDCAYVLMFHQVNDDMSAWKYEEMSISRNSFANLLDILNNAKEFRFACVDELLHGNSCNERAVVLTFDDGCSDVFTNAYPFLREHRIPFAVFVTTDFIGKEGYMSAEQLYILQSDPLCTIGSHAVSHPLLRKLTDKNSRFEIEHSKKVLEDMLHARIDYFAYPYGSLYACSGRDLGYVRDAKYSAAFSTIKTGLRKIPAQNRFFIPRINVNEKNCGNIIARLSR